MYSKYLCAGLCVLQRNQSRKRRSDNAWLNIKYPRTALALLIAFAFPVGIYLMWTDECDWSRGLKSGISLFYVALIVAVFALTPELPESRIEGSVEIVAISENTEMLGPLKPEGVPDTAQLILSDTGGSLISEPTPTPTPIWVYCNDNGVNYHLTGCRYVHPTTPRVTLVQALQAGKTACKLCKPPNEMPY